MSAPLQDTLRPGELTELRRDCRHLVCEWAAILLDVNVEELGEHPEREVIASQLTAAELVIAELGKLSRLLERQGWEAGLTQPELAAARGVTAQAVSQRLNGVKAG